MAFMRKPKDDDKDSVTTDSEPRISDDADKRIGDIESKIESISTQFTQLLEVLNDRQMPAIQKGGKWSEGDELSHEESPTGSGAEFRQSIDPTDRPQIVKVGNVDTDSHRFKDKAALLKWYEEKVWIHVAHDNAENPMMIFPISVNGIQWVFERGIDYNVPRYVVEGFLRARPTHYRNEEYTDENGVKKVRWPHRRGLRFPINLKSTNPADHEWFARVSREP